MGWELCTMKIKLFTRAILSKVHQKVLDEDSILIDHT